MCICMQCVCNLQENNSDMEAHCDFLGLVEQPGNLKNSRRRSACQISNKRVTRAVEATQTGHKKFF